MSKTYLPYEPDQQLLLPAALQEWLPDDHLAYFIPHFPYQPCRACRNQQRNYPM